MLVLIQLNIAQYIFNKLMKNRIVAIILFYLVIINYETSFGQNIRNIGQPFIQNYSTKDYSAEYQNWAIAQDKRGVLFFGNNRGLLEYDGSIWRISQMQNKSAIRSIAIDTDGKIYVGTLGEFGYLQSNSAGKYEYFSLSNRLKNIKFNETWKTFVTKAGVFFFAGRSMIFHYHNDKLIKLNIPENIKLFRGFQLGETIYAFDETNGLCQIINDSLICLNVTFENKKLGVYCILPFGNNKLLMGTAKDGIFIADLNKSGKKTLQKFDTEADQFFNRNQLYFGIQLNDSSYAFSTLLGGIVIMDKRGKIIEIINKIKGLAANGVYHLFQDKNKNLWLGMEKGIAQIWLNSPFRKFNETNKVEGAFQQITIFNHKVYIGSYNGIYSLPNKIKSNPDKIDEFTNITHDYIYISKFKIVPVKNNKEVLLATTLRAIVQVIDSSRIKEILKIYGCNSLCMSSRYTDRIFLGHPAGVDIAKIKYNADNTLEFTDIVSIKEISENITQVVSGNQNDYWVGTTHNGLIYLKFDAYEDLKKYKIFRFDTTSGLPSMASITPYMFDGKLLISTLNGIYSLTQESEKNQRPSNFRFEKENKLLPKIIHDSSIVYSIVKDSAANFWITSSKGFFMYDTHKKEVVSSPMKFIQDIDKENSIFIENQDKIWFGTPENLYLYRPSKNKHKLINFLTLIRKVLLNNNAIIYSGGDDKFCNQNIESQTIDFKKPIPFQNNTITIEYSAIFFEFEKSNLYKTYLEGYENEWTDWNGKTERVFTNLHEGNYTFHVIAKNIYDESGKPASFSFKISPPFYRTFVAYVIYTFLFFFIIYLTIVFNSRRLKKANRKLETLVRIRTSEIEFQKEEISSQSDKLQSQAESLLLTNLELKHLSLVAQDTDNSVAILNAKGAFEWWNKGFTKLFSYLFDKYKDSDFREFQRKLRPDLVQAIKNNSFDKESLTYTTHLKFDGNNEIWFQTTLSPVLDDNGQIFRYVAIDSDITKIKLAEREIENQKEEIQAQAEILLETNKELEKLTIAASETDNSILLFDENGKIEWVNEGFTKLFGFTLKEYVLNQDSLPGFEKAIEICKQTGSTYSFSMEVETHNKKKIWVQTTITPLTDHNNKIVRFVAIDSDITKIKEAEEEILKQRNEIEIQRDFIIKQNQEITDSILYASRIQDALLPPKVFLEAVMPEHFIMRIPRNIVSGDFYWVGYKNNKLLIAVADSTGHGVPGAFMSLLGLSSLKEIVARKETYNAAEILDDLREWVIMSLHQYGKSGEASDGMDIALVVLDLKNMQIEFAGANNSLFLVRNNHLPMPYDGKITIDEQISLLEIKGDKVPIGIHYNDDDHAYKNFVFPIFPKDTFYLSTDGYMDQFGGSLGRKFLTKQFKSTLLKIQNEKMDVQGEILKQTIQNWQGHLEQVDDILVMGIRI